MSRTIQDLTEEEFRNYVKKRLDKLEGLIDDYFQKMNDNEDRLTQNVDEAIDRAERAQRAVARLKKEFAEHEHEDDEE